VEIVRRERPGLLVDRYKLRHRALNLHTLQLISGVEKQAQELSTSAIRGMIGAGPSEQTKPLSTQEVKEVTETAGQNKTSMKVSRPSGEKVEVDAKESAESLGNGRRSWIIQRRNAGVARLSTEGERQIRSARSRTHCA